MKFKPKVITTTLYLSSVLVLGMAACSGKSDEPNLTSSSESGSSQQVGTNGQLIYIQSDNVRAAGYDEGSMIMTVLFNNGSLYEYYGVPAELWTSFVAAQPNAWSQVGYPRLVRGGIPYKRIG